MSTLDKLVHGSSTMHPPTRVAGEICVESYVASGRLYDTYRGRLRSSRTRLESAGAQDEAGEEILVVLCDLTTCSPDRLARNAAAWI